MKVFKIISFVFYSLALFFVGHYVGFHRFVPKDDTFTPRRAPQKVQESSPMELVPTSNSESTQNDQVVQNQDSKREIKQKLLIADLFKKVDSLQNEEDPESLEALVDIYEEILDLDKQNERALSELGNLYISIEDYERARNHVEKCVQLYRGNELCNGNLTNIYLFQQKLDLAKEALDRCLKNTPDNQLCHNNLGSYYIQSNNYKEAISHFEKILKGELKSSIKMERSYILYQLAVSFMGAGDKVKYREYVDQACEEGEEMACRDRDASYVQ